MAYHEGPPGHVWSGWSEPDHVGYGSSSHPIVRCTCGATFDTEPELRAHLYDLPQR